MQIKTTPNSHSWLLSKYWNLVTQLKTISLVRAKGGPYVWRCSLKTKYLVAFHINCSENLYSSMNSFPTPHHKTDFSCCFFFNHRNTFPEEKRINNRYSFSVIKSPTMHYRLKVCFGNAWKAY